MKLVGLDIGADLDPNRIGDARAKIRHARHAAAACGRRATSCGPKPTTSAHRHRAGSAPARRAAATLRGWCKSAPRRAAGQLRAIPGARAASAPDRAFGWRHRRRPVDDVAAIGGQRHAAARFHVRRARLGKLAGNPRDFDHRDIQVRSAIRTPIASNKATVAPTLAAPPFAEGFGAVAALEDERFARRGLARFRRLIARCRRSMRSPRPRQAAARPPRSQLGRGKRGSARREASASWRGSTRAFGLDNAHRSALSPSRAQMAMAALAEYASVRAKRGVEIGWTIKRTAHHRTRRASGRCRSRA